MKVYLTLCAYKPEIDLILIELFPSTTFGINERKTPSLPCGSITIKSGFGIAGIQI